MADVDEAVPVAKPKRRRSTPEKWNKKKIKLSKDAVM